MSKSKSKTPALDPTRIYSTAEVAALAGQPVQRVSMALSRHGIGRIVGRSRVVAAADLAAALKLLKEAKVGNPTFGAPKKP